MVCCGTKKGSFIETILVIIIFLTFLSETIQVKRENHHSFVGSCQVSAVPVTYGLHRQIKTTSTKW